MYQKLVNFSILFNLVCVFRTNGFSINKDGNHSVKKHLKNELNEGRPMYD